MKLTLKVWRQETEDAKGSFVTYPLDGVKGSMSFLEMMDVLNENLIHSGDQPVAFDHDCREGICGMCSMVINGVPHGKETGTTTCQLHMRSFKDGDVITIEPFQATAFPIKRDLVVDRSSFNRIIEAGGYVSVGTGGVQDANAIPIAKDVSDEAFDAATCIGCGACVAACKNSSATLFVSAKVSQLSLMPQGHLERGRRVKKMVDKMQDEGFGSCTNTYECEAVCPKNISRDHIARLNREYIRSCLNLKG